MFHSTLADLVFTVIVVTVWVFAYRAKDAYGSAWSPRWTFADVVSRSLVATLVTFMFGVLPALFAAALVGGRLA